MIAGFGFQTGIKRFPIDTAMLDQMTNDVSAGGTKSVSYTHLQVLEDISVSLLRKTESVTLPIEIPENFLEEFYYGNLEIGACSGETCSNHHLKEIISIQDELQAQLTPEQWALFRKCITLIEDQSLDEASYMFQHGYRLAVNLIVAGLKETKEKNKDGETI